MEKSLARVAYWPSRPLMPMPTCALVIMLTSLAPSPMAREVMAGYCLRSIMTTSAFCLGETRQHSTDCAVEHRSKNSSRTLSFCVILKSVSPPTTTLVFVLAISFWSRMKPVIWIMTSWLVVASTTKISMSCSSSAQEYPMLMAVSTLSPVNTHSLIPAFRMNAIVSATSSCSRSSIAVAPTNVNECSNFSAARASITSRFEKFNIADLYSSFQASYSSSESVFSPTSRVRRPSLA
mmetsp:Transcript_30716/g.30207  ORF Transcript_30716/g.30207 Transcript_30716/m.30207 type:complete len:236 (-) Transcript_30716:624-1331(-)